MSNGVKPETAVLHKTRGALSPAQVTTLNSEKGKQEPQVEFSKTRGLKMKVLTQQMGTV